jgi:hypothetical protein
MCGGRSRHTRAIAKASLPRPTKKVNSAQNHLVKGSVPEPNGSVLMKSFCGGSRGHLRCGDKNVLGGDTTLEPSYAVIALQMLPHAVGFSRKEPPWLTGRRRHFFKIIGLFFFFFCFFLGGDFFLDRFRQGFVPEKFHGIIGPATGKGTQHRCIPEHFL